MAKRQKNTREVRILLVSQYFRCPPFLPTLEKYPLIVHPLRSEYDIDDVIINGKDFSVIAFWNNNAKKFYLNNGTPINFSVAVWGYIGDPPGIAEEQLVQRASLDFWDKPNILGILARFENDVTRWRTEQ